VTLGDVNVRGTMYTHPGVACSSAGQDDGESGATPFVVTHEMPLSWCGVQCGTIKMTFAVRAAHGTTGVGRGSSADISAEQSASPGHGSCVRTLASAVSPKRRRSTATAGSKGAKFGIAVSDSSSAQSSNRSSIESRGSNRGSLKAIVTAVSDVFGGNSGRGSLTTARPSPSVVSVTAASELSDSRDSGLPRIGEGSSPAGRLPPIMSDRKSDEMGGAIAGAAPRQTRRNTSAPGGGHVCCTLPLSHEAAYNAADTSEASAGVTGTERFLGSSSSRNSLFGSPSCALEWGESAHGAMTGVEQRPHSVSSLAFASAALGLGYGAMDSRDAHWRCARQQSRSKPVDGNGEGSGESDIGTLAREHGVAGEESGFDDEKYEEDEDDLDEDYFDDEDEDEEEHAAPTQLLPHPESELQAKDSTRDDMICMASLLGSDRGSKAQAGEGAVAPVPPAPPAPPAE